MKPGKSRDAVIQASESVRYENQNISNTATKQIQIQQYEGDGEEGQRTRRKKWEKKAEEEGEEGGRSGRRRRRKKKRKSEEVDVGDGDQVGGRDAQALLVQLRS